MASSVCCAAHKAWIEVDASGMCSGRHGSLSIKQLAQCKAAERLCQDCQKERMENGALISTSSPTDQSSRSTHPIFKSDAHLPANRTIYYSSNGTVEGVSLSTLNADDLEMRCVPSTYDDSCKKRDMTVFLAFVVGLALVAMMVGLAAAFDFKFLPHLVHKLSKPFCAPRIEAKPDKQSPPPKPPMPVLSPAPPPAEESSGHKSASQITADALRRAATEADAEQPEFGLSSVPCRARSPPKRTRPPALGDDINKPASAQEERRIDPLLECKAVTYAEFCSGHADEILSNAQLIAYWSDLEVAHPAAMESSYTYGANADPFGTSSPSSALAVGRPVPASPESL